MAATDHMGTLVEEIHGARIIRYHTMGQEWYLVAREGHDPTGWYSLQEARQKARRGP